MDKTGWKVPVLPVVFLLFALPACGGDAESAADRGSESIEAPASEEQQDSDDTDLPAEEAVPETAPPAREAPPVREAPRTERREAAPAPAPERTEPVAPPERPMDVEPTVPADPPELTVEPPALEEGATLRLVLESTLSTRSHRAGDVFYARVTEELLAPDGLVLVPEGARVEGRVTESRRSGGSDEEAVLEVHLESLLLDDQRYPLAATIVASELETGARDSGTRTAAKVATGTAAGAMVGRILGGDRRSTVAGAVVGAAAGTAVALSTQDGHAVLEEGSILVIQLDRRVVLANR